jgi:hypothetical protein
MLRLIADTRNNVLAVEFGVTVFNLPRCNQP